MREVGDPVALQRGADDRSDVVAPKARRDLAGRHVATTTARPHAVAVAESSEGSATTTLPIPDGWEYLIHVLSGDGVIDGVPANQHEGVRGRSARGVESRLDSGGRAVLFAGEPLTESVVFNSPHRRLGRRAPSRATTVHGTSTTMTSPITTSPMPDFIARPTT